jgi:uncharacterized protein (DUF1800 family)
MKRLVRRDADLDPHEAWQPWEPSPQRPWTRRLAAHLYRRAGFAASSSTLDWSVANGLAATLDALFADEPTATAESTDASGRLVANGQSSDGLAAWWLLRMLQTPAPLKEKMTLFWHGHFATSAAKVTNPRAMLEQNRLLRGGALGKFEPLVLGISRDVAMLIYLDSTENRKTRPNENYARELMELFCLGLGAYSEQDIKQIARAFTGWEVRRGKFEFNEHQHDQGSKTFLGQTGNFDGQDAVRIVLDEPAAGRFIARKLARYFVWEDAPMDDDFIEPLARQLRESDFDIGAVVSTILSSQAMYSSQAIGHRVRSPVELAIGLLRTLEASTNMVQLAPRLGELGQLPFFPPSVKGWDGGRQWINASTLVGRANLMRGLVTSGETRWRHETLDGWVAAQGWRDPRELVEGLAELLVAVRLDEATRDRLVTIAQDRGGGIGDSRAIGDMLSAVAALPEFQLN